MRILYLTLTLLLLFQLPAISQKFEWLAGFDGFLGKPLNRNRFPEQVRRILEGEGVWEVYR